MLNNINYKKFIKIATKLTKNEDLAADLVHQVWINLKQKENKFKNVNDMERYFTVSIQNAYINFKMKSGKVNREYLDLKDLFHYKKNDMSDLEQSIDIEKIHHGLSESDQIFIRHLFNNIDETYQDSAKELSLTRQFARVKLKRIKDRFEKEYNQNIKLEKDTKIEFRNAAKKIKCLNTGKIYNTCKEAIKDLGLSNGSINYHLKKKTKAVKGYSFELV